jgi:uncharacterized phage protein (TIGR02216 family)
MTQRFPWSELMRFGLHHLRLSPRDFWNSTLREIASAGASPETMRLQNLQTLMRLYPDD